ncbi:hypothetical protein HYH02_006283 [Chlamydomonas schloesseri]|uniref:Uncharacterized protein n=1 Tax=Chlamydomonas schloesseri TaxID=2026947 RepID=A0A835WJ53_9CHLO|nr:hypothetical protein HYH02_006283 [Chlamydomonas schloesseri]|eukprot:KAG2448391.1 hypothetical protein HYH02_006283 [Chlamydomonas schloesseri]
MRLLKLSHSLRYQLSHPVKRVPPPPLTVPPPGPGGTPQFAQQAPPLYPPGAAASPHSPQGWPAAPQGPQGAVVAAAGAGPQAAVSPPGGRSAAAPTAAGGGAAAPHWLQGSLPPLKGPGTKSGPYTGLASKAWLEAEVRGDVEALRQHVDAYVTQRERRAFELERSAMRAEIEHLRKRLGEAEDKAVRLELMLPNSNGDFRALRAELEELEKEADQFSAMHERQAKATQTAVAAIKQALAGMDEIEQEFDQIQRIINNTMPGPAAAGGGAAGGGAGAQYAVAGGAAGAAPGGGSRAGSAVGLGAGGAGSPPVVAPRRWCGCLPFRREQ